MANVFVLIVVLNFDLCISSFLRSLLVKELLMCLSILISMGVGLLRALQQAVMNLLEVCLFMSSNCSFNASLTYKVKSVYDQYFYFGGGP